VPESSQARATRAAAIANRRHRLDRRIDEIAESALLLTDAQRARLAELAAQLPPLTPELASAAAGIAARVDARRA
jgi:hypothetical protein